MPRKPYVGRLAPAPTGALHLGNARTFLVAWLRARKAGGRILLRLEDLDHPRVKPGTAREVYDDLAWLGLDWDEGPTGVPGDPYVQSNRLPLYARILEGLRRSGRIYPCVCTRKEVETLQSAPNAGEDLRETRYPGRCRGRYPDAETARRESGREPGWRFVVEEGVETRFDDAGMGGQRSVLSEWSGDFLVARGDRAGYQLAAAADDHDMGVTEVVRGDDLLPSTHRQLALYRALGWEAPRFCHLPLVVGPDGRRLAKRHGDTRLSVLRARGGPERLLGWLAWTAGWLDRPRETSLAEVAERCDFSRMPRERIAVGPEDFSWLGLS